MNNPLISVITPTLNSMSTIGKVIESVLRQKYREIEHLFIDGLSSDETLSIIRKSLGQYKYSRLISEKDNGIYDAMNKGLGLCQGNWIYFMGADDEFHDENVLSDLVTWGVFNQEQIVYGDVIIRGDCAWAKNKEIYDGPFDLAKFLVKNICHQSIFYPRSVIEKVGFYSENYPVTADWDYNLRCFSKYQFTYVDRIIAYFQSGGRSAPGDNSKFYHDLPKNVLSYFNLDPNDPSLRKEDSPFAPIMKRFDEPRGGSTAVDTDREKVDNTCIKPVSLYPDAISEGISLFTAVKNRSEMLEAALQTWITHDKIDEIIILDWGSDESLNPLVQKYQNGKIMLAVAPDQLRWILSPAFNLAARLTRRSMILKIDADTKILPGFFEKHRLTPGIFFCGNWRLARNENEAHLNGNLFVYRSDFFKINGYNEFVKTYGWDDSDLYDRLVSSGLSRRDLDPGFLCHIGHGDRMKHQKPPAFHDLSDEEWARQNIFINRYLATKLEQWSSLNQMMPFRIREVDHQTCLCQQESADFNTIPAGLIREAERVAMLDRIAEIGFELPAEVSGILTQEELSELFIFLICKNPKVTDSVLKVIKKVNDRECQADPKILAVIIRLNREIARKAEIIVK